MNRGRTISFSFPPFAGWVKRVILACTGIFILELVLRRVFAVNLRPVEEWFALIPALFLPPSGFVVHPVLGWWREPSPVGVVDPGEVARGIPGTGLGAAPFH